MPNFHRCLEPRKITMSQASDFDFFIGDWHVAHRRLAERLVNSQQWLEFDGTTRVHKVLGGQGNIDDNFLNLPDEPYRAITLRSFDAAQQQWSIWWLDGRTPGQLDTPVVGQFEGEGAGRTGQFFAKDQLRGQPIQVRFVWTPEPPGNAHGPRWAQAFSSDGGKSWETNWVMDFKRAASKPALRNS
jgi:hypothetical protein